MFALPPKADIGGACRDVRFVPILLQKSALIRLWQLTELFEAIVAIRSMGSWWRGADAASSTLLT
jgi:hypothetical protein